MSNIFYNPCKKPRTVHQSTIRTVSNNVGHIKHPEVAQLSGYIRRILTDFAEIIYDRVMGTGPFFDDEFKAAVRLAGARARVETLQAGVPVFYRDTRRNLDIMERPGGRKFAIRFLDGASGNRNYEVLGELDETAA